MVQSWSSPIFHEPCTGDGRQRDVFPLPLLSNEEPVNKKVCRAVKQRIARRHGKTVYVNKAIHALNSLFYGGSRKFAQRVTSNFGSLLEVQRFAIENIRKRIDELGPPPKTSRSEALKVLRASVPSSYADQEVDAGSPVPMQLDSLSLPSGAVGGVRLVDALSGPVKEMVVDFENFMLADADKWCDLTDSAAGMEPYNDELLNSRTGYLRLLERLYQSGVLNFAESCRGRVGAFCVSKKSKVIDGKKVQRQRLVLDCRQTNLIFKAPPQTRLGSLAALSEAELPSGKTLYMAGADIKDCFYAVNMEPGLQEFFGLKWDISDVEVQQITHGGHMGLGGNNVPVIKVLPMGFSWSFYLVQHMHSEQALKSLGIDEKHLFLEGQPAPLLEKNNICIMPYCDNLHSICTDSTACQSAKVTMANALEDMGFELHEHLEASSWFETLGGVVDGAKGQVRPTNSRVWKIILAFEMAANSVVSPKTIQRLLGHSMVVSVLNRCGMSVFRKLYDFSTSESGARKLTQSEQDECLIFAGIAPLLIADLRREWCSTITCSDASPMGFGICERDSTPLLAKQHGRWNERWRFKRLPAELWKPRQRSEGWDILSDVRTVVGNMHEVNLEDEYVANNDFPEIPDVLMEPSQWRTVKMGKWAYTQEHITLKEARALLIAVRRMSRSSSHRDKKHLILLDNLALVFAVCKGRAHSFDLLRVIQKISAICLATNIGLKPRWVRSEVNVADAPSRGQIKPGTGGSSVSAEARPAQHPAPVPGCGEKAPGLSYQEVFEGAAHGSICAGQEKGEESGAEGSGEGSPDPEAAEEVENSAANQAGECREESSGWQDDVSGAMQCEFRDSVSVHRLLPTVRGLLEGERHCSHPVMRRGRQSTGRLHGCPVPRQPSSSRRRKDVGGIGILPHWAERPTSSQSESSEGMEKGDACTEQATNAESAHVWNGNDYETSGQQQHGPDDSAVLRPLLEARRSLDTAGAQCGSACSSSRGSIQNGQCGSEGFRGREAGQGGHLRHITQARQSKDDVDRKAPSGVSSTTKQPGRAPVHVHHGGVSKGVSKSRRVARHQRFASIPAATWRGLRGSQQWFSRFPRREVQRQMGDRSKRQTLCQDRSSAAVAHEAETRQANVLHLGREKHGKGDGRKSASQSSVDNLWPDVFTCKPLPKRFCLEIFAGSARISTMLEKEGLSVFPIDLCLFPSHNVLLSEIEQRILNWISQGRVGFVWLGMPCTTFSRARKHDGVGPGPLRSDEFLWGLPGLSSSDQRKVREGNQLFSFTMRILRQCYSSQVPFVLENPLTSMAWQMTPFQKFLQQTGSHFCDLDFCMYGEAWKKPTRLVYNFISLESLSMRCNSGSHICSQTQQPHLPLKGVAPNGKFWTLVAQPYPWSLAAAAASILAKALRG